MIDFLKPKKIHWLLVGLSSAVSTLLIAASYLQFRRRLLAKQRRLCAGSQIAVTARGQIEYAHNGNGIPVLIIHGAGGGYDQGIFISQLLDERFSTISISRFGYLRSPLIANGSPEEQADLYAALLDEMSIDGAFIMGCSAGGPSALQFALRHQDRCLGLILVAAVCQPLLVAYQDLNVPVRLALCSDYFSWLMMNLPRHLLPSVFGFSRSFWNQLSLVERNWLVDYWRNQLPLSSRRIGIFNEFNTLCQLPIYPLEDIRLPTLVFHAMDDPTVPYSHGQFANDRLPNAQLVSYQNGGHLFLGHQEQAAAKMIEFMQQNYQKNLEFN